MDEGNKRCSRCGVTQPLESFPVHRSSPDGKHYYCKSCQRIYSRNRYQEHREERLIQTAEYQRNHPQQSAEYARRYREAHPERFKESQIKYRTAHPEASGRWQSENPKRARAKGRRWEQSHKELIAARRKAKSEQRNEYNKNWRNANPDKVRMYNKLYITPEIAVAGAHRRRARKLQAPGVPFTADEWTSLRDAYGNTCLACGRNDVKLTADHVIPISKGGSVSIDNIQPLCMRCNLRKMTKSTDYRTGTV